MRKRAVQALQTPSPGTAPSPGDVCVGCVHKPSPHGCHYYYVGSGGDGISFKSPGGRAGTASWMLLCNACFVKHADHLSEDLDAGRVLIGCDMIWPDDLQITFEKN